MHPALRSPAMAGTREKILNLLHWEPMSTLKLRAWGRRWFIVTSTVYFLLAVHCLSMKNKGTLQTAGRVIRGLNAYCWYCWWSSSSYQLRNWSCWEADMPAACLRDGGCHPLLWSSTLARWIVSEIWFCLTWTCSSLACPALQKRHCSHS